MLNPQTELRYELSYPLLKPLKTQSPRSAACAAGSGDLKLIHKVFAMKGLFAYIVSCLETHTQGEYHLAAGVLHIRLVEVFIIKSIEIGLIGAVLIC